MVCNFMLRKVDIRTTIIAALAGALLFCIPVYIYLRYPQYSETWLLYLGSFLFMIVMWIHTMRDSKKRANNNENTVALIFASHVATTLGVIVACGLSFLLLCLFVPGYLQPGEADKILQEAPANITKDKTEGLSFNIFMAASVINFSVGSFTGIILPFYLKRNQTRDAKAPVPFHQRGTK
jgi:hypothetical protein